MIFYRTKRLFNDIDVNKILISKKEHYGKKDSFTYITGYDDDYIGPLCIMLPQKIGYVKWFETWLKQCVRVTNNKLLKK